MTQPTTQPAQTTSNLPGDGLEGSGVLDWRIWFGLSLTGAWLTLGAIYVSSNIGWGSFASLPAAELGNFLEGAFAPLAFLWLVIGYFLQQKELQQNTEALRAQATQIRRSAEQAIIQSEKMAAGEAQARQQTYLQVERRVRAQLASIGGLLFLSSQGADAEGQVTREERANLLHRTAASDDELFARTLLEAHLQSNTPQDQFDLFYGTETRARHSNNFIFTYERLMGRAAEVDPENILRDAFRSSSHGFIYSIMKKHQQQAPEELSDPKRTGTDIRW